MIGLNFLLVCAGLWVLAHAAVMLIPYRHPKEINHHYYNELRTHKLGD